MKTLIEGGTVVPVNPERDILYNASILVEDDTIVSVETGSSPTGAGGADKTIDAVGKIVFPGFINTHNHLFQTMLKGLGDDKVLSQWFQTMTAPSAVHLDPETVYDAASLGCLECINSGATTNLDYMYPHPVPELSDAVIAAYQDFGMRGFYGRGMIDTGEGTPGEIMQDAAAVEKDIVRLVDKYHNSSGGRVRIWLAPAAGWLASDAMLRMTWEAARTYSLGYTIHISETPFDREATMRLHGRSDAELLQHLGIVGPNVLMVHCVYLTERDIRMAKYYDMPVSHNPVSNMYLASGVAPVPRMAETGITVGLATDGAASNNTNDMLEVIRITPLLHKVAAADPTIITAYKVLEMATIDGARALGIDKETGSIEAGKKADLVIYNPRNSAKSVPMHNPVSTLVYSGSEKCIETVLIDGTIVKENGNLTIRDEEAVLERAQRSADRLSKRAGTEGLKSRKMGPIAF